ncbi:MAG: isopentenyl-diphosphate Delta-isomerase [bacterium]
MTSDVLAVNEDNEVLETVTRRKAHTKDGIRHMAYTVLVIDSQGQGLLAKRSDEKRLWPGYWDGTVSSHPSDPQDLIGSASRRLEVELGLDPNQLKRIDCLDTFEYKAFYRDVGVEWEICSLLVTELDEKRLEPDPSEVAELRWEPLNNKLKQRFENYSLLACPWFEIAFDIILSSEQF